MNIHRQRIRMTICSNNISNILFITLLFGVMLPAQPSHAETASVTAPAMTLRDAVARAQKSAPGVRSAEASAAGAAASVQGAQLLPNPTLSVEAENILGTGRYARYGGSETTYSVAMPLELGGKRDARTRVAQAEQSVAQVGVTVAMADLTLKVTQAFIAVAASERRLELANQRRNLAIQAERVARLRVGAGKVSPIDEQRAVAQRLRADVDVQRAERAVNLVQANLARLVGATQPFSVVARWFGEASSETGFDMFGPPLSQVTAEAQVAAAKARVDAARRARIPDLTVSAGVRRLKETNDTAAVVALSIPIPVFNSGHAELVRARAELDKAEAERSAAALDLAETLASARADVADARASAVSAIGPELAAAQEAARIARIGYAEGKFSQLDLIEAERSLSQTQEAAIEALATFHDARARLARLLGRLDPMYKD
jgi:cobalt-zinc-cadmium efflux system outer membrane protein